MWRTGKRSARPEPARTEPPRRGRRWSVGLPRLRLAPLRCASGQTAAARSWPALPRSCHSASGCRAGAASANAGSAWHAASMRVSVGYGARSSSTRRALASCGTRQTSASVGASPWQKRPVARSRGEPRLERLEPDVDPVLVPAVLLLVGARRACRSGSCSTRRLLMRMDVAGDRERDARARARARPRRPAAAAAAGASRRAIR